MANAKESAAASALPALMRLPEVMAVTHRSKGSIYRDMREGGVFPRPVRIGGGAGGDARGRAVAWRGQDIQAWIDALEVA